MCLPVIINAALLNYWWKGLCWDVFHIQVGMYYVRVCVHRLVSAHTLFRHTNTHKHRHRQAHPHTKVSSSYLWMCTHTHTHSSILPSWLPQTEGHQWPTSVTDGLGMPYVESLEAEVRYIERPPIKAGEQGRGKQRRGQDRTWGVEKRGVDERRRGMEKWGEERRSREYKRSRGGKADESRRGAEGNTCIKGTRLHSNNLPTLISV